MSASQQSLVDKVAADFADQLGTRLKADSNKLDAISQFTPESQLPKFARLGKDFAMQVIGNWWSNKKGGKRSPLTRQEVTEAVIEWLSSEVSEQISSDLVDYCISSVTQQRLSSSRVEETVDGSIEIDEPFASQTLSKFEIKFNGRLVMSLDITLNVDAKLTVGDALTKLLSQPELRIEEVDLSECEASVEVSGPFDVQIGEFKVPINGRVTLE